MNLDGQPAALEIIARMNATLVHRGPDDGGHYVSGPAAVGHRRLSIIDLARGHQPMHLVNSPLTIVYNGEIYNHLALRKQLRVPADRFLTTCDTETILVAYDQMGLASLQELRGMFAFAIHDRQANSFFIARDRLGIKPLYYYRSDKLFAFASEIKALLAHPDIRAEVNTKQLPLQLTLKYTLDDETLYRGIKKLLPGHALRLQGDEFRIERYWDLSFTPKRKFKSIDDAAHEFRSLFDDAVEARLMADVPLGVFLSGGIDSSVIAASMAKSVGQPIKAFSIAFAQTDYSELTYSRMVAEHVGADVREMVLRPERWFSAWPKMVYHEDEPLAHPSSIPLHFVSMLAAQDVKVVLTGEGADELLAGYERYYQTLANLRYGKLMPPRLRPLTQQLIDLLPDRWMPKRKAVRTAMYLPRDVDSLFLDNYAAFSRGDFAAALQPEFHEASLEGIYSHFSAMMDASDAVELLDKLLYADIKSYLLELLMKQDQMSMSASLESRVPFLDHHLVDFVCSLPTEYKLRGRETKRILRKALGGTIPRAVVTRSKKGFPTPTKEWFRNEFSATMKALLLSDASLISQYIQPAFTRGILDRHISGQWDLQEQIWTLGNLELWLRIAIDGQDPESALPVEAEELLCASSG
jgi:asparagine synthase (glutamine-hydrolysing)